MSKSNQFDIVHELQRLLADGWGKVFDSQYEKLGAWFKFPAQARSANDDSFIPPLNSTQNSVKKNAKPLKSISFFCSWCQNVLTGKNGTTSRRYWGSVPFSPVGPGVKTITPPQ